MTNKRYKKLSKEDKRRYDVLDKNQSSTIQCLTMIDPATGWFEIAHIPQGNFNLARVSQRFNSHWLSRYPRPEKIIFDNGSEFKLHFAELVKGFQVTPKPTTVKTHKLTPS